MPLPPLPTDGSPSRLAEQLDFMVEIDRLKTVLRRTLLVDSSRPENTAEHSWHIALSALLFAEHAGAGVDVSRVVRMLLVHDVVEIDAGDTFAYDEAGYEDKAQRERAAARRIFGLLPDDQGSELAALWEEFEARETADARFANAVDRLQPMLHNFVTEGHAWKEHGVTAAQVRERNRTIGDGAPELWRFAQRMIDEAVRRGYIDE